VARQVEAAHRTSLAKGEVGIRERKVAPSLREFCNNRFEPWARATFEKHSVRNWHWYRGGLRAINSYTPLAQAKLDEITAEITSGFAAHEQTRALHVGKPGKQARRRGLQVSSVNSSLRVLRRILRLALEWGVLEAVPRIKLLPGERHRERVITTEEEASYLFAASPLLREVATVLLDTGLRPDECYRLRWEDITRTNGRNGTLLVTHGKTSAARRVLPMTVRVKTTLEDRWARTGKPIEGWTWPAPTQSGHIDHCSLKKQHSKAIKDSKVRPFVLYNLRHTFLTRLGESGCDAWTLARVAGHSSVSISSRYVHPSHDAVLAAVSRLDGHNSRHNKQQRELPEHSQTPEVAEAKGEIWCARRDSNSRPIAPEAIALSI
jgi:integrase